VLVATPVGVFRTLPPSHLHLLCLSTVQHLWYSLSIALERIPEGGPPILRLCSRGKSKYCTVLQNGGFEKDNDAFDAA
jgi:hypothetical protein